MPVTVADAIQKMSYFLELNRLEGKNDSPINALYDVELAYTLLRGMELHGLNVNIPLKLCVLSPWVKKLTQNLPNQDPAAKRPLVDPLEFGQDPALDDHTLNTLIRLTDRAARHVQQYGKNWLAKDRFRFAQYDFVLKVATPIRARLSTNAMRGLQGEYMIAEESTPNLDEFTSKEKSPTAAKTFFWGSNPRDRVVQRPCIDLKPKI